MPHEKWGCVAVTRVIASVFYFVRWFVSRFGGAVEQTHAADKLWSVRWLVRLGQPLAVHEHHSNQTSCE